jgi:hypothetical protein
VPLLKWLQRLDPVFQLRFASGTRAVDAAENLSLRFDSVPDDPAVALRTNRRQRVDRALEAIESVTLPANDDFKRLVIFVLTNFAFSHTQSARAGQRSRQGFPSAVPLVALFLNHHSLDHAILAGACVINADMLTRRERRCHRVTGRIHDSR